MGRGGRRRLEGWSGGRMVTTDRGVVRWGWGVVGWKEERNDRLSVSNIYTGQ